MGHWCWSSHEKQCQVILGRHSWALSTLRCVIFTGRDKHLNDLYIVFLVEQH